MDSELHGVDMMMSQIIINTNLVMLSKDPHSTHPIFNGLYLLIFTKNIKMFFIG